MKISCLVSGVTGGGSGQSYRAGDDIEEGGRKKGRRQKKKDKREKKKEKRGKKGKLKAGNNRACAKAGPEHATVTTVRLGAHYSDYGALGSIFQ